MNIDAWAHMEPPLKKACLRQVRVKCMSLHAQFDPNTGLILKTACLFEVTIESSSFVVSRFYLFILVCVTSKLLAL